MIRINLLNERISLQPEIAFTQSSSKNKKFILLGLPVIVVAIVAVVFVGRFSRTMFPDTETLPEISLQKPGPIPKKPEYKPKVVISNAVEEIVKEIENENRVKPSNSGTSTQSSSGNIDFQLLVCKKALAHIKNITNPEIGFTDVILTTPGDIYIHGMATSKENYQAFKKKLEEPSFITAKPGILKVIADNEETVEFSIYGQFKIPHTTAAQNRAIKVAELTSNISKLKEVIAGSSLEIESLKLKSVSNSGNFKKQIYQLSLKNCSFGKFQNFINKLQLSQASTGILKFALKASGDESMTANLDIVLYLN